MQEASIIGISRHRILRDGEGVTKLVGMAGCPLYCSYCINKEILKDTTRHQLLSPRQLLNIVRKDDVYYRSTNGGITFGGGEPLLHLDFIREFISICPRTWKINVETSLNIQIELLPDIFDLVDCFIVDIKTFNPDIYKQYTGCNNDNVTCNLSILSNFNMQDKVLIRIPLIPNYNNGADVQSSIEKLSSMGQHNYKIVHYVDNLNKRPRQLRATKYGKGICNILKHIRTVVAAANGVRLNEDNCPNTVCQTGSCPKCDDYLVYLTEKLTKITNPIY